MPTRNTKEEMAVRRTNDLEDRINNLQVGKANNLDTGRIEEMLELVLREIKEIKATLSELARSQSPQPPAEPQKAAKKRP